MRQRRVNAAGEGTSGDKRVEGRQWLLFIKQMYAQIGIYQLGCERRVCTNLASCIRVFKSVCTHIAA